MTSLFTRRWLSSSAVPIEISKLSAEEMTKYNKTSARLYRILLKNINGLDYDKGNEILLQPPVNHRDYGTARALRSDSAMYWSRMKDQKENQKHLLSFYSWWTQYLNETFYNDRIDDKISSMLGPHDDDIVESLLNKFLCVSKNDLLHTARSSFHMFDSDDDITRQDIIDLQRFAIEALKLTESQKDMWCRTSINEDHEKGLRIIATSSCIGVTAVGLLSNEEHVKNRFAYRIRIENFNEPNKENEDKSYQLLGRNWIINEDQDDCNEFDDNHDDEDSIARVDAPTTGVVGHLPVLNPGDVFEYVSGCDLRTRTGYMQGEFYMSHVPSGTISAQCGDVVDAFKYTEDKKFRIAVAPFRLIANESIKTMG